MKLRQDHKLHLVYGALIASAGRELFTLISDNVWHCILFGFAMAFLAGLAKEVHDSNKAYGTRRFDAVDWSYTVVGGVVFCIFTAIIALIK